MKDLEIRLQKVCDHVRQEKEAAIELLKDYIRQHGEIDWSDESCPIETTFYGDGYYTATIKRVLLDDDNETLIIDTDLGFVCEHDGDYTNDTILDILCSVIGNTSVVR